MPETFKTRLDVRLEVLLRDYGYRMAGDTLIRKGIRGFCSDEIVGRFKSVYAACEHLCPIIRDDEFTSRFMK